MKFNRFIVIVCSAFLPFFLFGQNALERNKLSAAQQQHAKVYLQITQQVNKGKCDFEQILNSFYAPIAKDCERLSIEHRKLEKFFRQKANESMGNSKQEIAKKQEKARLFYQQLADLSQSIQECYKKQNTGAIDKSLIEYKQIETSLISLGAKPPQRNWVTVSEAEQFVLQVLRYNQAKKQPKR